MWGNLLCVISGAIWIIRMDFKPNICLTISVYKFPKPPYGAPYPITLKLKNKTSLRVNVLSSSLWFGATIWCFVSSFIWYLLQKSEVPADYDKHDPEQKQIYRFVRTLFSAAQLTAECAIVTLVHMLSSFDWCPKLAVVFLPLIERPISTCMHDTTQLLSSRSRRDQPGLRV